MSKATQPLTDLQRQALLALAKHRSLRRTAGGYQAEGAKYFSTTTLYALRDRGLARIDKDKALRDVAHITRKGQTWAKAEASFA